MNLSLISFLVAMVVITLLITALLKQKARPTKRVYSAGTDDYAQEGRFNSGLVQSRWAEITAMQNSGPSGLKSALMDADKLLDYTMIGKGFTGDTMGERLKMGGDKFSDINAVWAAHKLRNEIAHQVEHDLVPSQVKEAVNNLGRAIKDLGVKL